MASLVLRAGRCYAPFCDGGRKPRHKRIALGTSARGAARKLLVRLEEVYTVGDFDP